MNLLFRKLRANVIGEGKLKRYLIYALGEIVLVVIGILIALQVNNQNELRKKHNLEMKLLSNLKSDLQLEVDDLEHIIKRRESKTLSAQKMAGYHSKKQVDTLKNYYFNSANVLYWEVHYPNNKTFQELINSGNFSLIRNKTIKSNLLEIEGKYDEIEELRKHMNNDYEMFFYKEYKDIFDFSTAINVWANPDKNYELSRPEVEKCLSKLAIKNGYTFASFNNAELGNKSNEVLKLVRETITFDQSRNQLIILLKLIFSITKIY